MRKRERERERVEAAKNITKFAQRGDRVSTRKRIKMLGHFNNGESERERERVASESEKVGMGGGII